MSEPNKQYSVVLVDDHPIVRAGIKTSIEASGVFFVAGEASNGEDALKILAETKPDLVVVDLSMPRMNGVELVSRISKSFPETMAVVLTVHEEPAYVQQVIKAGGRGYLLKRSAAEELVRALMAVLKSGVYIDPAVAARMLGAKTRSVQRNAELSEREDAVMRAAARGFSNKEIATRLELSVKTIETYKVRAMQKLDLKSRADLIRYGAAQGWINEN